MRNNLEKFLVDEKRNNEIFEDSYAHKYKVYKENYGDRFSVIYYKKSSESILQNNYDVGGYYDKAEKTLYNANYNIRNMFLIDNKIRISSFSDIENKIYQELNEKIKKYIEDNKTKLKQNGKRKFDYLNEYDVERIKDEVNRVYIMQENPTINLEFECDSYSLRQLKTYKDRDIYLDYLKDSDSLVSDLFNEFITLKKEEIGFEALIYDYKDKYLSELKKSKSSNYNQIKLNRNIYQSIRGIYAKSVNINIEYSGNNINFKFDFDNLKRALAKGYKGTSTYGIAYTKVSDFIRDNDPNRNDYNSEFDFSHINFITYGKKEIYNKNNFKNLEKKQNKSYER